MEMECVLYEVATVFKGLRRYIFQITSNVNNEHIYFKLNNNNFRNNSKPFVSVKLK